MYLCCINVFRQRGEKFDQRGLCATEAAPKQHALSPLKHTLERHALE